MRVNLEERGLDTVFRIMNSNTGTETYLLEKWGESKNEDKIESEGDKVVEDEIEVIEEDEMDEDDLIEWSRVMAEQKKAGFNRSDGPAVTASKNKDSVLRVNAVKKDDKNIE